MGADINKASRSERLASALQYESETFKHIFNNTVDCHADGGELDDVQKLEDIVQGKVNFRTCWS